MRKDYDIVGSYDNQRVSTINAERTVNLFQYDDPNGKRPSALLSTSGLVDTELNFTPETGGSRASYTFNGEIYQVFGGSVFIISGTNNNLSRTEIGTLNTDQGYVGISANTFQVIIVDGQAGYIWDINAQTYTQIADAGFPEKPIDVTYLDGFFVVADGDSNNFQLSSFEQGMVWSGATETITATDTAADTISVASTANFRTGVPITFSGGGIVAPLNTSDTFYAISVEVAGSISNTLIKVATSYQNAIDDIFVNLTAPEVGSVINAGQLQQASINTHPGNIVACRTLHRLLFLFSENYTEVWENAGLGTNLPFRRNNTMLMEVGTPAIGSIVVGFDRMFFLSQDRDGLGSVMAVQGSESIPVSNRALDYQLAQYAAEQTNGVTRIADARGILIKENGLIFYRLNFTHSNHTFVMNVTMSTPDAPMWHEEEILNGNRHPAQTHAFFGGVNYYGHYNQPKFYRVDPTVSTNDGETIRRMRIGKPQAPEGYNRLRIDRFQLDLLQGHESVSTYDEAYLEAESSDDLLTEDDEMLLLDQQVIVNDGQPVVFLSYSKDGGQTYGNRLQGLMGKLGERTYRTVWRKLGTIPRGQSFVPKIEFFNETPFIILGAAWDFEVMPE